MRPPRLVGRRQVHDLRLGGAGGQLAGERAVAHHEDPVGHADQLGHLGRDHQDRDALAREPAHQVVDAGLRADVDAARRLVEDQHARLGRQPLGEHDLLLVAAREEADLLLERARRAARPSCASSWTDTVFAQPRGAGVPPSDAQRQQRVVADRLREREPLELAVLGDEAHAGARSRCAGRARAACRRPRPCRRRPGRRRTARARAPCGRSPGGRRAPTISPARTSSDVAQQPRRDAAAPAAARRRAPRPCRAAGSSRRARARPSARSACRCRPRRPAASRRARRP